MNRTVLARVLGFLCLLAFAPLLSAQTFSMSGTTITNYPASGPRFVLNTDRASDNPPFSNVFASRWYITGQTTLTSNNPTPFSRFVQVRMRLVSATGAIVPCENANASGYVSDVFFVFNGNAGTTSVTRAVNLVPIGQIDAASQYRVEAIAVDALEASLASNVSGPGFGFRFVHFIGPNGTDANNNVVSYLENSATYQQTYLVQTDAANEEFIVHAPYTLYRFDEPQALPTTSPVFVRFLVELFENSAPAVPIALAQPYTAIGAQVPTYATNFLQIPSTTSGTQTLRFKPAAGVQLDSPGKTYFAKVSIEHIERLSPTVLMAGNSRQLGATRFLHFNGRLTFGAATANPINTTLTSITNNPQLGGAVVAGPPQRFDTSLAIGGAVVDGGTHSYTANPAVTVSLLANGNAIIRGAASVTLTPPSLPDRDSVAGVRFDRSNLVLDVNGGTAGTISTILPAGMGWATSSTSKTLNPRFNFSAVQVNQQLEPVLSSLTWLPSGSSGWVTEESKPIYLRVTSVSWTIATGRFDLNTVPNPSYVRSAELSQLEGSPLPSSQQFKRSNESYWRWAQATIGASYVLAGQQGGAEFHGKFSFANASGQVYRTHFPWNAAMIIAGGSITSVADVIDSANSTLTLNAASPTVAMPWLRGCLDPSCDPSGAPSFVQSFTPDSATLRVTADGGLVAKGIFASTLDLKWGFIPSTSSYAHRVTTPFTSGTFAVSGIFLRGADRTLPSLNDAPGVLLFSGVDPSTGNVTERPGTNGYANGRAEYPGFNVSLGANDAADSGIKGQSVVAGVSYGPYALKNRCKWYVRPGGVTGIQDKVAGPAQNITLYGYLFTLTNYGLSFLDNGVKDSRLNGKVVVPAPSDVFVDFNELKLFCNGGLDKAKIANTTPPQTLAYWQAPIDILAMQFLQPDSCSVSEGYLTLGLLSYSSHITDTLSGTVGFLSNGNLINKQFSDAKGGGLLGLDSRFKMPKQVKFQGPKRQTTQGGYEDYIFTPVVDAYLNVTGAPPNWTHNPGGAAQGFWNFGGRLKVSFFEAPKIHLQTSPNRPPANMNQPGNWQTSVIHIANGKWDTGASTTSYFDTNSYHDTWNRGYPYPVAVGSGTGESLTTYRTSPAFMTIARQAWLGGAIEFRYKLQWTSATRSFASLDASQSQENAADAETAQKVVILKIDHRLPYLSAERAELTFGASYSGLPKLNLANFVVNQLDDASGVFKAATQAGCGPLFDQLDDGLNSLAKMLNDQLRDYFNAALDPLIQPVSGALYGQLSNLWTNPNFAWDPSTIDPILNNLLGPAGSVTNGIKGALKGVGGAADQFQQIRNFLDKTKASIDAINTQLLTPVGDDLPLARNLARELIKALSQEIGGTLGALIGGAGIDQKIGALIDPLLKEAQPSLADLRGALTKLSEVITDVRATVNAAGDLGQELIGIANAQAAEIDNVTNQARVELRNFLLNSFQKNTAGKNFLARSETEIRLKIENAIYDRFFGTQLVGKVQTALKHRLQDVEVAVRSGLDSVFGEVNKLIKKAVSGLLAEVDESINGVLGEFSDYVGSGSVQGYATFNGDALRKLRMDGRFQFKVPDPTNVEAFLEVNQYTSKDKPPGCYQPAGNDTLTEVIIGAHNVPCDFLTPGVKINLDAKFSFITQGSGKGSIQPVGLAGSLEMVKGPINYEAFKITKLAVGVAFGRFENYFSAALGLRMGSYGATGGVFFGRTCSIAPITLWDPFAAKALGNPNPSFTGIYVYGEVHIPVSEVLLGIPATCFFEINADAGVGFFVFAEGPSYGARMALGVDGHVLCILGLSGRIDLLGGKVNGKTKLAGRGEFCASILFIEVCKDVEIGTSVQSDGSLKGKGDAH